MRSNFIQYGCCVVYINVKIVHIIYNDYEHNSETLHLLGYFHAESGAFIIRGKEKENNLRSIRFFSVSPTIKPGLQSHYLQDSFGVFSNHFRTTCMLS